MASDPQSPPGGRRVTEEVGDEAAYRRLWASVIIQALIDATREASTPSAQVDRDQARAWFLVEAGTTAQNFEAVCLAAEIEPGRVRAFVKGYEGPPLTLHKLSRLRDSILGGGV